MCNNTFDTSKNKQQYWIFSQNNRINNLHNIELQTLTQKAEYAKYLPKLILSTGLRFSSPSSRFFRWLLACWGILSTHSAHKVQNILVTNKH